MEFYQCSFWEQASRPWLCQLQAVKGWPIWRLNALLKGDRGLFLVFFLSTGDIFFCLSPDCEGFFFLFHIYEFEKLKQRWRRCFLTDICQVFRCTSDICKPSPSSLLDVWGVCPWTSVQGWRTDSFCYRKQWNFPRRNEKKPPKCFSIDNHHLPFQLERQAKPHCVH